MSDKSKIQNPKYIYASYYKDFVCTNSACEDSCCTHWDVEIDKNTFEKYKKVKDEEVRKIIDKYVCKNEESYDDNVDYGRVKLTKNKNCPFLDDKKLCKIQINISEEYLSNVCHTFPRFTNLIDDVYENSMTLSCPESARIVLLKEEGISFDVEGEKLHKKIVSLDVNTKDKIHEATAVVEFHKLREFSIWIMKNRKYEIWERLLLLGYFHEELEILIKKNKTYKIAKLINSYKTNISKGELDNLLDKTIKSSSMQLTLMIEFVERLDIIGGVESKKFIDASELIKKELGILLDIDNREKLERYVGAVDGIYEPFMNAHEYMFENYFVNHIYRNLYPFSEPGTPFDSYMMMIIRYVIIKLYLAGIGSAKGGLTKDITIDFIQIFSKTVEHHRSYLIDLADFMRDSHFNNMEYMNILLKSNKSK
ncbi:MAG: flagellin lysine-N-methylase [Acidaminobacteraceae bacterium]